jgi:hypothetical protein
MVIRGTGAATAPTTQRETMTMNGIMVKGGLGVASCIMSAGPRRRQEPAVRNMTPCFYTDIL